MPTHHPAQIFDLIDGFRRSQTLFAAVKLGIFDGRRPQGPGVAPLLEACAALGLLEKSGSEYVNTPIADEYLRERPGSLAGYIRFASADLYARWADLDQAVMGTGSRKRQGVWAALSGVLRRRSAYDGTRDFMAGMHAFGLISSPRVAEAFDLSRFRSFADLGGSTGHLALAIRERYPQMKVGVFDRANVIEVTREYTADAAALYAGDLFTDPLPPADLYGLGKVLHNCSKADSRRLLGRIYAALPEGGGLLIVERLLDEDRRGPVHVHMSSLNMLVAAQGSERTFSEYRKLLAEAGFTAIDCRKTGALVDAILAFK